MATKAKTLQAKDKEKDDKAADAPEKDSQDAPSPLLDLSDAAVKKMIKQAKKRGFVTFDQLNEVLPSDQTSPEQIEDIMQLRMLSYTLGQALPLVLALHLLLSPPEGRVSPGARLSAIVIFAIIAIFLVRAGGNLLGYDFSARAGGQAHARRTLRPKPGFGAAAVDGLARGGDKQSWVNGEGRRVEARAGRTETGASAEGERTAGRHKPAEQSAARNRNMRVALQKASDDHTEPQGTLPTVSRPACLPE